MCKLKPGSKVHILCKACGRGFIYTLTRSPFRKKFCETCASRNNSESKKRFEAVRRDSTDMTPDRKAFLALVKEHFVNPTSIIRAAHRAAS